MCENATLCGNHLNLYQTVPGLNDPGKKVFLKTSWEKEKMLEGSCFTFDEN